MFVANADDSSVLRIQRDFGHTEEDARSWLSRCRYGDTQMSLNVETFQNAVEVLKKVGLVDASFAVEKLWGDCGIVSLN